MDDLKLKSRRFLAVVPYTCPEFSGSGINAFSFVSYLVKSGIRATLLSFNRQGRFKPCETIDAVHVKRILYFNQNMVSKIFSLLIIIPSYLKEIIRHDIVVIYGAHVIAWEIIVLTARLSGRQIVFQSLLLDEDDLGTIIKRKSRILRPFYRCIFKYMVHYQAINSEFSERYLAEFNSDRKLIELAQGVNTDIFTAAKKDQKPLIKEIIGQDQDTFLIVSVGFLIARKGYEEVFTILSQLDIPFHFLIIGEFEFDETHFLYYRRKEAENLINRGKELLGERLTFYGPSDNVHHFLQAADIFLLNSVNEGTPNSLLEAMSCELPVVCRKLPGLEGFLIVDKENGHFFSDPDQMKDIILSLYSDPALRITVGNRARSTIVNSAGFGHILAVYNEKLIR